MIKHDFAGIKTTHEGHKYILPLDDLWDSFRQTILDTFFRPCENSWWQVPATLDGYRSSDFPGQRKLSPKDGDCISHSALTRRNYHPLLSYMDKFYLHQDLLPPSVPAVSVIGKVTYKLPSPFAGTTWKSLRTIRRTNGTHVISRPIRKRLMDFLQSTYEAGADLAHWDRAALDRQD